MTVDQNTFEVASFVKQPDELKSRIENVIEARSLRTYDRSTFELMKQTARDKGIKIVEIKVNSGDFDSDRELKRIFEEGASSEAMEKLKEKYGDVWFDELMYEIEHVKDKGIDPVTFIPCIEVSEDVDPNNREYQQFSNNLRGMVQSGCGIHTIAYAPNVDLLNTELRVYSQAF